MKIQHLISTMGQKSFDFVNTMNCKCDVLIVNQNSKFGRTSIRNSKYRVDIINTKEVGLSNSRNMLLRNSTGDICIIGDDDLVYRNGYLEKIVAAYKKYDDADIIIFRFSESPIKDTRKLSSGPQRLNIFSISKAASVEITFKRTKVLEAGLSFDPVLGLGAPMGSGEENAFLADALRAGLKIQYVPETICHTLDIEERKKWVNGFNESYFILKGACFYRIYGDLYLIFCLAFLGLKKWNIFRSVPFFKAIVWMSKGKKVYKQKKKELENEDINYNANI